MREIYHFMQVPQKGVGFNTGFNKVACQIAENEHQTEYY